MNLLFKLHFNFNKSILILLAQLLIKNTFTKYHYLKKKNYFWNFRVIAASDKEIAKIVVKSCQMFAVIIIFFILMF